MKVIVVDDDSSNIELIVKGLKEKGFQLYSANGPAEAMEIIDRERDIEWVITDMVMPEIDGDRFIEMLSDEKYAHIRIIAMTSQSLGLLNRTFAKHKKKKKVFPTIKPINIDLISKLMGME
jgi:CheY-like chemotaxis protein